MGAGGSHEAVLSLFLNAPLKWDDAKAKPKAVHSKVRRILILVVVDH